MLLRLLFLAVADSEDDLRARNLHDWPYDGGKMAAARQKFQLLVLHSLRDPNHTRQINIEEQADFVVKFARRREADLRERDCCLQCVLAAGDNT